jgi:phosphatidate cytidylyltransferase
MGALYWAINQNVVACCMYNELGASSLKDWLIYIVLLFSQLGQIINKTILHKAGYKRNDHLWLHYCLYDYNAVISFIAFALLFIWYTLQRRLDLSLLGYKILGAILFTQYAASSSMFYFLGVFWTLLIPGLVIINDTMAYAVGKLIGKRKLIKLSPNKTVEGFLGGACFTFIGLSIFLKFILRSKELTCVNHEITTSMFKSTECGHQNTLFEGVVSPATVVCLVYAIFTSLYTPFAGFFASGLKRSLQIKNFSSFFPGHGGFLDRYDCWIFATLVMHGVLVECLYLDELAMAEIETRFIDLDKDQQSLVISWISNL